MAISDTFDLESTTYEAAKLLRCPNSNQGFVGVFQELLWKKALACLPTSNYGEPAATGII